MNRNMIFVAAALGVATLSAPANAATLIGDEVNVEFTISPNALGSGFVQLGGPAVVGSGVELTGSFTDVFNQDWTFDFDVTSESLIVDIAGFRPGGNANIDGISNLVSFSLTGVDQAGIWALDSFSGPGSAGPLNALDSTNGQLSFNLSGFRDGQTYQFGFTPFASTIPEPTTWMLLLLGFFGIGSVLRRQRIAPLRSSADVRFGF
ncbi:MAG: PEP-CTERM sorting domain-containing protein [Pseudomonadota bacterium]